jgi:cellulose synthase operon protein C
MRSAISSCSPCQGALVLFLGIATACASPPSLPPPEVEYAGCQAVLVPGPVCVLGPQRELRLWVGAPGSQIGLQVDGRRLDAPGQAFQEGQQLSLTLPAGAKKVEVIVEAQEGRASWSLSLAEAGPGTSHDVLREFQETLRLVHDEIQLRRLDNARELLESLALPPRAPAESRYQLAYYRGLLAAKEGDYRTALAAVREAGTLAERVRLEREQRMAQEELAVILNTIGRWHEAAQLFDRLRGMPQAASSCEGATLLTNQAWSALLAREAGESFADPTRLLESALAAYEACGSATAAERVNVLLNLALAHLQEGRLAQAKDLLARARELEPDPPVPHTLWWLDLEARIALREGPPGEALQRFEELDKLALETGSSDGRLRAAFGQARSHVALGDRAAALESLDRAETLLDERGLHIPVQEGRETFFATRQATVSLHVELLLDQGRNAQALDLTRHARSRVLRQLEHGDRLANLAPERRARWESLLTSYQARRKALENRAKDDWRLPLDRLRREQAARTAEAEAVKKVLDQAFLLLQVPGERPDEAPPPPRPGELILAYQPLPRGWVGFAALGRTVAVHRFELPPDLSRREELARRLLLPFRDSIRKARRIRILPCGPLRGVDFHALPFDGDVLLARGAVVYGLDLPGSAGAAEPAGRRALLVADPRGDLPGALDEARGVRGVLESGSRPWITEELQRAAASADAVRGRLAGADLLHYAGHGTYSGFGGWESGLLLAEETQLTLSDLLALERVPAWVVLSGCDTGRSAAETPVDGVGLAHAFLLAGSRAVVASTRPADDRTVPAFFADVYRQWRHEPDLAVALQRAQLAWRERSPDEDWPGFRLFEP